MSADNRSVLRAFSLLRAFHCEDNWVSVSELSRRASLPFASTYRLLQTLEKTGAVEKGDFGAFRLGFLFASLSQNVNISDCLFKAARDLMEGIAQRLEVSTFLGRLDGSLVTFVGRVFSPQSKRKFVPVSSQSEAYCSALGRTLLAHLPEDELDAVVHKCSFAPLTPHTITNKRQLKAELALVRRQGYAVEREQAYLGVGCVAVPIFDNGRRPIAALAAGEDVKKLTPTRVAELRDELMHLVPGVKKKILPSPRRVDDSLEMAGVV